MDLFLLLGSAVIGIVTVVIVRAFYDVIAYNHKKNAFERKFMIMMSKSDQIKLTGSEKALFKLEGQELDLVQRIIAQVNYNFLLNIKDLIYFVELSNKLSIKDFVFYSIGCAVVLMFVFGIYFKQLVLFSVFGVLIPYFYLLYLRDKKIKMFVSHFPGALEAISSNLKAGADLIRAITLVASDEDNFFSKDFRLILAEIELGVSISDAFENYAKKIGIPEVELFSLGIKLSMRSGANLAVFFTKISEMIRKRIELKGKVNIVTSESRFSMIVMISAPIVIATLQSFIDPQRYVTFLQSTYGQFLIYGSIVMIGIAIFWVHNIMKIED